MKGVATARLANSYSSAAALTYRNSDRARAIKPVAMDTALLLFRLLPAFSMVGYGVYLVVEVFFPSFRNSDFGRWEVDDDSGSSVTILGWTNVLKPPRVIAQGYFSERTACNLSLILGGVLIVAGLLMIRHMAGVPESVPDLFGGSSR